MLAWRCRCTLAQVREQVERDLKTIKYGEDLTGREAVACLYSLQASTDGCPSILLAMSCPGQRRRL